MSDATKESLAAARDCLIKAVQIAGPRDCSVDCETTFGEPCNCGSAEYNAALDELDRLEADDGD